MAGRLLKLLVLFLLCWGVYSSLLNPRQRRDWHGLTRRAAWVLLLASALVLAEYWLSH